MKHSNFVLAALLAVVSAVAQADDEDAADAAQTVASKAPAYEFRSECIALAVADEVPDDQMKQFVDQCIADMSAGREPVSGGGGD